jgi:AraC-like DNA-binding protein
MLLFGFVLALFFSILLLTKKNKSKADWVLFFWMFLISIHLLLFFFSEENLYKQYPHLIGIDLCFPIFHALFLFFYIRTLTSEPKGFNKSDILHFIPSVAIYIYLVPFFMKGATEKYIYYLDVRNSEKYFLNILLVITILSGLTYAFLTFRMIKKYRIYIGQNFSFSESINLVWMNRLLIGMIIIWLVVVAIKILQLFSHTSFPTQGDYIIYITANLFVFFLGYFGVRQTNIFSDNDYLDKKDKFESTLSEPVRYKKSSLKEDQALVIKEKLVYLMDTEKRYLDNKLTLDALAKEIDISPNYLSQVINEQFSKNFYDFVNTYRIEDFKIKTNDPKFKNYSILALALECGFNSKSAFYSVFKKYVGQTPSEYLKKTI